MYRPSKSNKSRKYKQLHHHENHSKISQPPRVIQSLNTSQPPRVIQSLNTSQPVNNPIDLTFSELYDHQLQRDIEKAIELSLRDYKPPKPKSVTNSNIIKVKFINSCSICQESFNESDDVNILVCKHMFHKDCINQWLNRSNTCPLCRCKI